MSLNPLAPPVIGSPPYWQGLGEITLHTIESQRETTDPTELLRVWQVVMGYWGKRGLTDLVALMVLYAHVSAPDEYRHPDGRPSADLLVPERADAMTPLHVTDHAETIIGPSGEGAAADLTRAEDAIASIDSTRALLQEALDAAHRSTALNTRIDVQKALAPARRDMGVLASMLALANTACRTISTHLENPHE